MDEQRWLTAVYPLPLVRFATTRFSDRKLRLFACACARSARSWDASFNTTWILHAAEHISDAPLSHDDWVNAQITAANYRLLQANADEYLAAVLEATVHDDPRLAATDALGYLLDFQEDAFGREDAEGALLLVREVFGNPFRPLDFAPWRTDTAVTLARTVYESREFGAMPILADALQDAECDNDEILRHCRDGTQVHVRGCWVVDGVLGLE